ncbi:alpha/beta hydrolase [Nocardia stercoris]|nr:alpha/beta hydrolase [Nocardia stercoris]
MRLRRNMIPFAAALLAVLSAGACRSAPPTVAWHPCPESAALDCGSIAVPIDWAHPDGATIDLAVTRKRATGTHPTGTLISLPGGPGTSGVDELRTQDQFSPALHDAFDIVSFDPRGVGRSHPIRCDQGLLAQPDTAPESGHTLAELQAYAHRLADSCRTFTGPLFEHVDEISVARDVDALRAALGRSTVALYGRSYGTMSGQAYLELFPQRVRALLIDSVDDHSLDGPGFLAAEARAGGDTFGEFVSWCDREAACALHGSDIPGLYDRLWDSALHGTLADSHGRPSTALGLSTAVTQRLYQPDWTALANDLAALRDRPPISGPVPWPQPTGVAVSAGQLAVCSDWTFDIPDQARWTDLWSEQNRNAGPLHAHFAWAAATLCSGWPIPPADPAHLPSVTGGPAVLVMNSIHDPATPYEWAAAVAAHTPRATLLTYDGWGHGVYSRTPCTTAAGDAYLISGTVPAAGTHCPAA